MSKSKFKSGDRIVFYNLQPIPRRDGKVSWVDDRPLCIYGYKKVHATVNNTHWNNDRLWINPDDRPYEMVIKDEALKSSKLETEDNNPDDYIYLQDLKKGHPLYFGGGIVPKLKDKLDTD